MLNLLQGIVDAISSLFDFVVHAIQSLFSLISQIPRFVTFLGSLVNFLPPIFQSFAVLGISIFAVLFMLGRNKS